MGGKLKRHNPTSTFHKMPVGFEVEFVENPRHEYFFPPDPVKVDSVSTIVKAADDGSRWGVASWYGQRIGAGGVRRLAQLEADDPANFFRWLVKTDDEQLKNALTASKLTVNHHRGKAAERGTAVHKVGEHFGRTGVFPRMRFPKDQQGFVKGLKDWLTKTQPSFVKTELVVASKVYRFAGTLDGVCMIDGKTCLIDYKTSEKGAVYTEAHLQAAGYELALLESYGIKVDEKWIIGINQEGEVNPVKGQASTNDFLAVLDVYNRLKNVSDAIQSDEQELRAA